MKGGERVNSKAKYKVKYYDELGNEEEQTTTGTADTLKNIIILYKNGCKLLDIQKIK